MVKKNLPTPATHKEFLVKVKTGVKRCSVGAWAGDYLEVSVSSQAQEGKANRELVKFLSKKLGSPVRIRSGQTSSRKKMVFL